VQSACLGRARGFRGQSGKKWLLFNVSRFCHVQRLYLGLAVLVVLHAGLDGRLARLLPLLVLRLHTQHVTSSFTP